MSPLLPLIAPASATLAAALVAALWQGTLLVLLTLLGLRLFPAISAAARSIVWLAALLLLALLNTLPLLCTHIAATASAADVLHVDPRWSLALAAIWASLSLARGVRLLHSAAALHSLSRRAIPLPLDPNLSALLLHHNGRRVAVCASSDVDRPSVVGFFKPTILLPNDLACELSPADLAPVLLHEMEHLRRRDDWTNLFQKLALVLFPLSPALLWVEHRLCEERELACDDGVLRATGARKAYATCLASLAEHSLLRKSLTLALGAWDHRSALEIRIRRILSHPASSMTARRTTAAVAMLVLAATGGACIVAHAPQFVSFSPAAPTGNLAKLQPTTTQFAPPQFDTLPPAAHMTLAKAIMPSSTHRNTSHPIARPTPRVATLNRRAIARAFAYAEPRETLTRWQQGATHATQLVATEPVVRKPTPQTRPTDQTAAQSAAQPVFYQPDFAQPVFQFSYAAVRVPDGWLIIQL